MFLLSFFFEGSFLLLISWFRNAVRNFPFLGDYGVRSFIFQIVELSHCYAKNNDFSIVYLTNLYVFYIV